MTKENNTFKSVSKEGREHRYTVPDFLNKPVRPPRTDIKINLEESLGKGMTKKTDAANNGEDLVLERDMNKDKAYTGKYGTRNHNRGDDPER